MDDSEDAGGLPDQFRRWDERNRENVARARLGMRTSADIFEALQREHEQARSERGARAEGSSLRVWVGSPRNSSSSAAAARPGDLFRVVPPARDEENARGDRNPAAGETPGALLELFGRHDERNRQNVARARLGIRTSADLFQAAQSGYENARAERVRQSRPRNSRKRNGPDSANRPQLKRARTASCAVRSDDEQMRELTGILRSLDEEFAEKEQLSHSQAWCAPVPDSRKVSTVQEFYKAFHDKSTLQTHTCMICYRKCARAELEDIDWDQWMASPIGKPDDSPFQCRACFPVGEKIPACADCARRLRRGVLSPAAQLHSRLGCEHMFPDELKGLTPVEEKVIALNSCYGFITKYSVADGHRQSARYPKHIKGHITVFPNNVQELVTNVLPHPLLQVMDEIHVSWQGVEKPAPSDLLP